MALATKPFRIEQVLGDAVTPRSIAANSSLSSEQHQQIMDELAALKRLVEPAQELNSNLVETFRSELSEAVKIKKEMDEIYEAIAETKREIATPACEWSAFCRNEPSDRRAGCHRVRYRTGN